MGRKLLARFAVVGVSAALVAGVLGSVAQAAPGEASKVGAAVAKATAEAGAEASVANGVGADAVEFTVNGGKVSVPKDASGPVRITGTSGTVQVGLPASATADDAVRTSAGTVVYPDAGSAADVAVQTLVDGTVRALVVIQGKTAATEYRFPLTVPTGATVKLLDDGSVGIYMVTDHSVEVIGALAAPWAKDDNGRAVPTRYRLDGNTVIQEVDHQGAAYPVVADPSYTQGDFKAEWELWAPSTVTVSANKRGTDALMYGGSAVCGSLALIPIVGGAVTIICGAGIAASGIARLYDHCTRLHFDLWNRTVRPSYYKGGFCS